MIDDGLLQPIEDGPKDRGEESIAVLSEEIVFGMLKARDFGQIPQDEIWSRLITAAEAGRSGKSKSPRDAEHDLAGNFRTVMWFRIANAMTQRVSRS